MFPRFWIRSSIVATSVWLLALSGAAPPNSAAAEPHAAEPASGSAPAGAIAAPSGIYGAGASYWGTIPEPADSVSMVFANPRRALWEYPLLVPYRIVELPLRAFWNATGAAYNVLNHYRVPYFIGQLLAPKDIPYGAVLVFKSGGIAGAGGGFTIFHNEFFGEDNRLKIRTLFTTTGTRRATIGTMFGKTKPSMLEVGGGYVLRQNARYFGLGPDSREIDKSFYSQETGWGGFTLHQELMPQTKIEFTNFYSTAGTRRPHEDRTPALPDTFRGPEQPFGFGMRSDGYTGSIAFVHNDTREDGRPEVGGVRRLAVAYFGGTSDDKAHYWSYRADVEQFLPLWFTERALALRGIAHVVDERSDRIPFQRLLTNDEPDLLRGFDDYRFRDRGFVSLTTEYRWPLWANLNKGDLGLDAYILNDIGQVFEEKEEITRRNVTVSWGGGLRLITRAGFRGRIEIARSDEDTVVRIATDQIFQHEEDGFYNGRDQAALR